MDNNVICSVKNRSSSRVVYKIPEDGIRREFAPGETKKLSIAELEKLSYQPGGIALMANFLQIQSAKVVEDLGVHAEPEYHMTESQIIDLIKSGSIDAFLDCLDFAPVGVIDLLKKFAVQVPLEDYEKRIALKEKTGFDVDAVLKNLAAEKAEEENTEHATVQRRIQPVKEEVPAGRRTSGQSYKIITKTENSAE